MYNRMLARTEKGNIYGDGVVNSVSTTKTEQEFFESIQTLIVSSQYPQMEDFFMRSGDNSGDHIILHLNVYKMLEEDNEIT